MNIKIESTDAAVSPVVGVMLMLVVTIVIAALVSSFAGGLGATAEAAPMLTIGADLSVANGLILTPLGATSGKDVSFDVCIGDEGSYYKVSSESTSNFKPGSFPISVSSTNLDKGFTDAYGAFDGYKNTGMYVPNTKFIGQTYTITLMSDGKVIGKTTAVLTA